MTAPKKPDKTLQTLLDDLERKKDDEVAVITLTGRALSRSAKNLHVAVSTGIVAVPIANIQQMVTLAGSRPGIIRFVVRNPSDIRSLLGVGPIFPSPPTNEAWDPELPDGVVEGMLEIQGFHDVGVNTCDLHSTDTVSGGDGNLDQSDDELGFNNHPDDEG